MKSNILKIGFLFCLPACWDFGKLQTSFKKVLSPLEVAQTPLNCQRIYKKIATKSFLSKKEREKLVKQAEACLINKKTKESFLIFKKLLTLSQRQSAGLKEIKGYERRLAELTFYNLEDYEKALRYYTALLKRPQKVGERFVFQYHIAESFFKLKKYSQALREVEKCFFKGISLLQEKKAKLLKGRIFIAEKNFDKGILFFKEQIQRFPEEEGFFREYLALIYEMKKDFALAIEELEKIQPQTEFIKRKIQRLRERRNQQPGA